MKVHMINDNLQSYLKSRFPIVFAITLTCVSNISYELQSVTVTSTLIVLSYALLLGVNKKDLLVSCLIAVIFTVLSHRFSLSLLFPLLSITIALKQRSISNADYIVSMMFLVLIVILKSFFDFDDYIYLDRNQLGLVALLLSIVKPEKIDLLIKLQKLVLIILTLFLLSRTYMLCVAFFIILTFFWRNKLLSKKIGAAFPLVFLILVTSLTIVVSLGIDTDSFVSNVGNDKERISELNDASNKARIIALHTFVDYLLAFPESAFLPTTIEDYQDIYNGVPTPHNSLLAIIFNYGIPISIIYLYYIGSVFNRLGIARNFFVAFTPYFILLGGVIYGPTLILFCIAGISNDIGCNRCFVSNRKENYNLVSQRL